VRVGGTGIMDTASEIVSRVTVGGDAPGREYTDVKRRKQATEEKAAERRGQAVMLLDARDPKAGKTAPGTGNSRL
jgi:hypothetical protein